MANIDLNKAKKRKADEFYTQLTDIEKELVHYKKHFKGKTVFCNCDDPETSNFYYYFVSNFEELGLKKLIATHFETDKPSYALEYCGGADVRGDRDAIVKRSLTLGKKSKLKQNHQQGTHGELFETEPTRSFSGDFRSPECVELLKASDVVVTNPPFSLFREYVAQLVEYDKKFIIIGHQNAISYKEIFPLIKSGKLWLGYGFHGGAAHFINKYYDDYAKAGEHKDGMIRVSGVVWFTNLDHNKRHEDLLLYKKYTPKEYPKYDNYDAIEVSKVENIPEDYDGVMGVPITFMGKYNPEQFEIIGQTGVDEPAGLCSKYKGGRPYIKGKRMYTRLFIKRKHLTKG